MAGSDSDVSLEGERSNGGSDIVGDWIAPIVALVLVLGIFLALAVAILAPIE